MLTIRDAGRACLVPWRKPWLLDKANLVLCSFHSPSGLWSLSSLLFYSNLRTAHGAGRYYRKLEKAKHALQNAERNAPCAFRATQEGGGGLPE